MSLFAGVYSRQPTENLREIPAGLRESLARLISRSDDPVMQYSAPGFFLVKIDVGAFPTAAWVEPSGPDTPYMATLTGHPFFEDDAGGAEDRTVQLRHIAAAVAAGDYEALRRCHGIFALCHYDPTTHALVLAADKLCNRPLYVCVTDEFVFFATALRVLEELPEVPKRIDMQGLAEYLALDYPLADRTVYADIKLLHAAEVLICDGGTLAARRYCRWDAIEPTPLSQEELVAAAYERFRTAVQRRCMGEDWAVSMLSGGLDSRACVSMLKALDKRVFTLTLLLPGFWDGQLAVEYARALGVPNMARPTRSAVPGPPEFARLQTGLQWPDSPMAPGQTNRIFSGDGGSLGLGHIYMSEERIELLRRGKTGEVVRQLAGQHVLPGRLFQPAVHRQLRDALSEGLRGEFDNIHSPDPGRNLYLFYLLNDQRRHIYRYFEHVDLYRFDHVVPFFDGRLLETVVSGPIDAFLWHRFYQKWIRLFPEDFFAVPWQVYPGHEPCPVPNTIPGRFQWNRPRRDYFAGVHRERMWECARTLFTGSFPSNLMRRDVMAALWLLHASRIRRSAYALRIYVGVQRAHAVCDGHIADPQGAGSIDTSIDDTT